MCSDLPIHANYVALEASGIGSQALALRLYLHRRRRRHDRGRAKLEHHCCDHSPGGRCRGSLQQDTARKLAHGSQSNTRGVPGRRHSLHVLVRWLLCGHLRTWNWRSPQRQCTSNMCDTWLVLVCCHHEWLAYYVCHPGVRVDHVDQDGPALPY